MEEARGYGSFAVSGLGEVEEIKEIVLKQAIGEHARLQVKVWLTEESAKEWEKGGKSEREVQLLSKSGEKEEVLFCGLLEKEQEVKTVPFRLRKDFSPVQQKREKGKARVWQESEMIIDFIYGINSIITIMLKVEYDHISYNFHVETNDFTKYGSALSLEKLNFNIVNN